MRYSVNQPPFRILDRGLFFALDTGVPTAAIGSSGNDQRKTDIRTVVITPSLTFRRNCVTDQTRKL